MKIGKVVKKVIKFSVDNYFISIFLAIVLFVGFVSIFKYLTAESEYVYVQVKVSQGLWWASTQKPSIWMVKAIKKGEKETSLTGSPTAEILSFRYYPWYSSSNQYDVYLNLKLKVTKNKKTGKYNFKRSTLTVASPVDFEFPSIQLSGTVIELSEKPIAKKYLEKTVYLSKKSAYPWEYDAIKVGDSYFDGEDKVLEIIDKSSSDTSSLTSDALGNYLAQITEPKKYIQVKVKIKGTEENNQFIYGEDQIVSLGKTLNLSTANFTFGDYVVGKIE